MLRGDHLVLRVQMWVGSLGTSGCTWSLHAGFRPFDVLGTMGFWAPKRPCRRRNLAKCTLATEAQQRRLALKRCDLYCISSTKDPFERVVTVHATHV